MAAIVPPTSERTFALENGDIIYDNIELLQDDYLKLLDHMRITGETAVPLWVFRSFCESYARFMRKVLGSSDKEYSSPQNTDLKGSLDDEGRKIQDNGLMMQGALAVGEAKETVSRNSGMQEHSDPDRANTGDHTDDGNPKDSNTDMVDAYEVIMRNVKLTTMDLSNRHAMLQVAEYLITSNGLAPPYPLTTNYILYLRWHQGDVPHRKRSDVCIGFTSLELATKAVNDDIQWAGKSHRCAPFATGRTLRHCSRCFSFDHFKSQCKMNQRCQRCGSEHHPAQRKCRAPQKCISCGGTHNTNDPKCPRLSIEMRKAGLWPLRAKVVNASAPPVWVKKTRARKKVKPQPQTKFRQSPASLSLPTDTFEETDNFPDPSDPKKIIEHLDRLRNLVIASRPTPSIAKAHKRKAQAPDHRISEDSLRAVPKRLKREEVKIKQEEQEEQEDALAQWERLYT